jgi:hypothetical protein
LLQVVPNTGEQFRVVKGFTAEFRVAGHILGSSQVLVHVEAQNLAAFCSLATWENTISQSSAIPKLRRHVTIWSSNQLTEIGCTMSNGRRRRWSGLSRMPLRTAARC